jgi:hypothetical protein
MVFNDTCATDPMFYKEMQKIDTFPFEKKDIMTSRVPIIGGDILATPHETRVS